MTNLPNTTVEKVFAREREFDDVRVPLKTRMYWPDFSPTRARLGAREWLKSSVTTLLVLTSVGVGFGTVGLSGAFFADTERSTGNTFTAQLHDFATSVAPEGLKVIPAESSVLVPVAVTPVPGSPNLFYRFSITYVGGEQSLCDALVASTSHPFTYNGPLLELGGTSFVTPSTYIEVSLPNAVPDLPVDAPCTFDVRVSSWNALVPESTGYTDAEIMQVTIIDPPAAPADAPLGATSEVAQIIEPETTTVEGTPSEEPPVEEPTVPEPEPEVLPEPEPIAEEPVPPVEEPAPEPQPEVELPLVPDVDVDS